MNDLRPFVSVLNVGSIVYKKNNDNSISEGIVTKIVFRDDYNGLHYYRGNYAFGGKFPIVPTEYWVKFANELAVACVTKEWLYRSVEDAICNKSISFQTEPYVISGNLYTIADKRYCGGKSTNESGMIWAYFVNGNKVNHHYLNFDCWIDFSGVHVFSYDLEHKQAFISSTDAAKNVNVVVHKLACESSKKPNKTTDVIVHTRQGMAKLYKSVEFTIVGKRIIYEVYDDNDEYLGDVVGGNFDDVMKDIDNLFRTL